MRNRAKAALVAALSAVGLFVGSTPALAVIYDGNFYCGATLDPVSSGSAVHRAGNNPTWNYSASWCSSFVQSGGPTFYYSNNMAGTSSYIQINSEILIDGPIYFERFMYLSVGYGLICSAIPNFGSRAVGDGDRINIHVGTDGLVDQAVLVHTGGATEVIAMYNTCTIRGDTWFTQMGISPANQKPYTEWVFDDVHGDEWTNSHWIYAV